MCYSCGSPLPTRERIGFRDPCPDCGRSLHVCRNCRFYKPGAHWDCAETVGELVTDKERGNFCEWFVPIPAAGEKTDNTVKDAGSVRSRFDDLFTT